MRVFRAALLIGLLLQGVTAFAQTATEVEVVAPADLAWEAKFRGVDYATFTLGEPRRPRVTEDYLAERDGDPYSKRRDH